MISVLSGVRFESNTHLFFECAFSQQCLQQINSWSGVRFKPFHRMDFRKLKGNTLQRNALCAIFSSTIYYIWRSRNEAIWDGFARLPLQLSLRVQADVRARLLSLHLMVVHDSSFCRYLSCLTA